MTRMSPLATAVLIVGLVAAVAAADRPPGVAVTLYVSATKVVGDGSLGAVLEIRNGTSRPLTVKPHAGANQSLRSNVPHEPDMVRWAVGRELLVILDCATPPNPRPHLTFMSDDVALKTLDGARTIAPGSSLLVRVDVPAALFPPGASELTVRVLNDQGIDSRSNAITITRPANASPPEAP